MNKLKVLVACEESGAVRDAFIARGHFAMSCDLIPTRSPGPHWQGDVMEIIYAGWDLMVAHPPCTFLSSSGLHWNKRRPERAAQTEAALDFVRTLLAAPIPKIALENPVGCISSRIRKPDQIIQPYDFGDDASKATCLWLKGLAPLRSTLRVPGRMIEWPVGSGKMVERWANQTDSGQNVLGPHEDRKREREARLMPGLRRPLRTNGAGV